MTQPQENSDREAPPAILVGRFYAERNREYPLRARVTSVGRSPENTLRIPDSKIAPEHVRIHRKQTRYVLEAVSDEVPTRVNGEPVEGGSRRTLEDGDVIALSDFELRFGADDDSEVQARLVVTGGVHRGKVFRLEDSEAEVGRAVENTVQFPDKSVSRRQARLWREDGSWWIEDRESTNGTYVNGERVRAPRRLENGDHVVFGFSQFQFRAGEEGQLDVRVSPTPRCN